MPPLTVSSLVAAIATLGLGCAHPRAPAGESRSPLDGIGAVELVQDGFAFVEGLRWWPARGVLLVSDAYGEVIYELQPPGRLVPFRTGSNGANGLDVNGAGHLVAAEVGAGRETQPGAVSRRGPDGTWADAIRDYRGLVLAHPNDIVALRDGTIFFSDLGLPHRLVRIDPQGALSHPLQAGDHRMNGLATSPDQTILYVSGGGVVRSFELQGGSLGRERASFATEPTPDGMCVDAAGNLYVGTRRGVQVWDPRRGRPWGLIALPGLAGQDRATDCEFAGADGRTLYISAVSRLFRVRLAGAGRSVAAAAAAPLSLPPPVPGLPIGYCTGGEGRTPEEARAAGFEFVEVRLRDVAALSDEAFAALEARTRALGIPVLSAINLLPAHLRVVGPEIDRARQQQYLTRALARGARLGIRLAVFGSGGSRSAPPGYSREAAFQDLVDFGRWAAAAAQQHGITVVVEALNRQETNMVNTAAESLRLVRAVGHPHFQMLIDHYHMSAEKEDPAIILQAGAHIRHVQIANPHGRRFPQTADESDYATLFRHLHKIGYRGGISLEARTTDFPADSPGAIALLRQLLSTAAQPAP